MIVFRYLTEIQPPAPFVAVTVGHPVGSPAVDSVPARVDSAADRTVIPQEVADALRLEPIEQLLFEGLGGHNESMLVYLVTLTIKGLGEVIPVAAAAHPGEPVVLLGRDVLNRYRLTLDGPNQRLEIG